MRDHRLVLARAPRYKDPRNLWQVIHTIIPYSVPRRKLGQGAGRGRGGSQTSLVKSKAVEVKSQMQPGHERGLGTNGILGFVQRWDRGCEACVFSQGLDTG